MTDYLWEAEEFLINVPPEISNSMLFTAYDNDVFSIMLKKMLTLVVRWQKLSSLSLFNQCNLHDIVNNLNIYITFKNLINYFI